MAKAVFITFSILLLLSSCVNQKPDNLNDLIASLPEEPEPTQEEQARLNQFEAQCQVDDGFWMKMPPMLDNVTTSNVSCWGCMPNPTTHPCSLEEYQDYRLNNPDKIITVEEHLRQQLEQAVEALK